MSVDGADRPAPLDEDEPPPFGGTWKRIYAAVVVYTCLLILALYAMSIALER